VSSTAGSDKLLAASTKNAAPLEIISRNFPIRVHWLVSIGAMTAMLGVLLNLLLGLPRVLLAMGRRGDMPRVTSKLAASVLVLGSIVAALAATGSVETTWTFSAFTVLIYYAITNLAAIRLSAGERLYSSAWAWIGLLACLGLAFAIERHIWAVGLGLLVVGIFWHCFRVSKKRVVA
jgi:APA family basic amino acid/polyamine antiporter